MRKTISLISKASSYKLQPNSIQEVSFIQFLFNQPPSSCKQTCVPPSMHVAGRPWMARQTPQRWSSRPGVERAPQPSQRVITSPWLCLRDACMRQKRLIISSHLTSSAALSSFSPRSPSDIFLRRNRKDSKNCTDLQFPRNGRKEADSS